jgi:hypothetical protein
MVFGLSSNLVFGTYPLERSLDVVTRPRISYVISQVSWVIPLFISTVGKRSTLRRAQQFCRQRTLDRLRVGANRKDLFYYLVSSLIGFFDCFSPDATIERRGTP